jgi:hypothetical protein
MPSGTQPREIELWGNSTVLVPFNKRAMESTVENIPWKVGENLCEGILYAAETTHSRWYIPCAYKDWLTIRSGYDQ